MCDASSYQPHGFAKDFNSCMQENVVTIYTCYEEGYVNSYSVSGNALHFFRYNARPTPPESISVSEVTSSSVRVQWSPVPIKRDIVHTYIVYYRYAFEVTVP